MAGSIGPKGKPISAINVTPFVDVVLVLLVIFMVTAPMIVKKSLEVNLPKAENAGSDSADKKSFEIQVLKSGNVKVDSKEIAVADLESFAKDSGFKDAMISADSDSKHGDVIRVVDILKKSGITGFSFQIQRGK